MVLMEGWSEVARVAASGLRQGTLKLRDLAGLTDVEMAAVAEVAAALQRSGRAADARAVLALLLLCDPTGAGNWRLLADLHHGVGDHAVAVACYEAAALLGGRVPGSTSLEADSLRRLGHGQLADDLVELDRRQAAARRSGS